MKLFSKLWDFLINNLDRILVGLLVFLVIIFIGVMSLDCVKNCVSDLIGLTAKNKILTFLGIGMGGILFILQVLASHRRAKAMEKATESQAKATKEQARANENTEQGLRQERLKNAIEHLGYEKESVRWGGAYELFHLAKDSKELSQTVLDMLCLHIRQTTSENEYREAHVSKPSEEIQSLLRLLFVQEHEVFKGCDINLQGSWLNGADLRGARLEKAILRNVHLRGADLERAHLQESILIDAQLQGVSLVEAHLQMARLDKAYLQGSNLWNTRLQRAFLYGSHLQGSIIIRTQLQDAFFDRTHLEGVTFMNKPSSISFEDHILNQIGKKTNLSGAIFAGGLTKGVVNSLVEGLSDEKVNELRERLEQHIDKPKSNELPENSGAITGAYTREEAEQWIAEYTKITSENPGGR